MIKKYERKAGLAVLFGILSFIAGIVLIIMVNNASMGEAWIFPPFMLLFAGIILTGIVGTAFYAKAKGYSPLYCLLGFVGFFVIALMPDTGKET